MIDMGFSMESMAAKLRGKRAEADLSQAEAAEMAGINITTLVKYEAGDMVPSAEKVFMLAEVYGCTPNDLFGLTDERLCAQ